MSAADLQTDFLFSNFGNIGSSRSTVGTAAYGQLLMTYPGATVSEKAYNCLESLGVTAAQLDSIVSILKQPAAPADGLPVSTAEELAAMSPDGSYYLTADLEVTDPLPAFGGTLDGCGHRITLSAPLLETCFGTVSNLVLDGSVTVDGNAGAVTPAGFNLTLRNVISSADVSGTGTVGGLVGIAAGSLTVTGCTVRGNVTGGGYTGGLAGFAGGYVFMQSDYNYGTVTGLSGSTGTAGILGGFDSITSIQSLLSCGNFGDVTSPAKYTAGVCGSGHGTYITYACCFNLGTVTYTGTSTGQPSGIAAFNISVSTVATGCYNAGRIAAANAGSTVPLQLFRKSTALAAPFIGVNAALEGGASAYRAGSVNTAPGTDSFAAAFDADDMTDGTLLALLNGGSGRYVQGPAAPVTAGAVCGVNKVGDLYYDFGTDGSTVLPYSGSLTEGGVTLRVIDGYPYTPSTVAVDCTHDGGTLYTCALNGDSFMEDVTPALGHSYLPAVYENVVEPTYTHLGSRDEVVFCDRCKQEIYRYSVILPCLSIPFDDIPDNYLYEDAVRWALENGVLDASDPNFEPWGPVTKSDFVLTLWKAAGCPEASVRTPFFTDVTPDDPCYEALLWAKEVNAVIPASSRLFNPDSFITRVQVIWALYSMEGRPGNAGTVHYNDTYYAAYYIHGLDWAVEEDIAFSSVDDLFLPHFNVSGGVFIEFIYRYITGQADEAA